MSDNVNWISDFGHAGLHTTFHHQHFQMVNLMILHCNRAINRLNPHELPCAPIEQNAKHAEEKNMPSKGEKVEQQSQMKKSMTGYDFGWKMPSSHSTKNKKNHKLSPKINANGHNRFTMFVED